MLAVTAGAFLLVTWIATKGLFVFLQPAYPLTYERLRPSEIQVHCESIMEDGELTYDEFTGSQSSLNNHQEACSN